MAQGGVDGSVEKYRMDDRTFFDQFKRISSISSSECKYSEARIFNRNFLPSFLFDGIFDSIVFLCCVELLLDFWENCGGIDFEFENMKVFWNYHRIFDFLILREISKLLISSKKLNSLNLKYGKKEIILMWLFWLNLIIESNSSDVEFPPSSCSDLMKQKHFVPWYRM